MSFLAHSKRVFVPVGRIAFLCCAAAARAADPAESGGGWVKHEANPVLGGALGTCFDVSLLKENGVFRMWLSWRPKASVALAESRDGVHWSAPQIVLAPNPATKWEADINRPCVVRDGDRYRMWYTGQADGHSWIGCASSPDGVAWTRESDEPRCSSPRADREIGVPGDHSCARISRKKSFINPHDRRSAASL